MKKLDTDCVALRVHHLAAIAQAIVELEDKEQMAVDTGDTGLQVACNLAYCLEYDSNALLAEVEVKNGSLDRVYDFLNKAVAAAKALANMADDAAYSIDERDEFFSMAYITQDAWITVRDALANIVWAKAS